MNLIWSHGSIKKSQVEIWANVDQLESKKFEISSVDLPTGSFYHPPSPTPPTFSLSNRRPYLFNQVNHG